MRSMRAFVVVVAVALAAAGCSSSSDGGGSSSDGTTVPAATDSGTGTTTSAPTSADAGDTATDTAGSDDYTATPPEVTNTTWLCRPGLADNPCDTPRAATAVQPDGTKVPDDEKGRAEADPPIDCFYVYPTVSGQKGVNADLTIDPEEQQVAVAQASRFSDVCKVYAPMYRQLTLNAIGGSATPEAREIAYGDVESAWKDYLANDNKGRGVVLIGHSQGAGMLNALVKAQIDEDPKVRKQLVSALLLGGNVLVPEGKDVGGDFANVPACRADDQTGCVVAFSTFDQAPPENALFGRPRSFGGEVPAGSEVLCTNPAALDGGSAPLHPYFPTKIRWGLANSAVSDPTFNGVTTDWATTPDLFTGECASTDGANYLKVTDVRQPGDVRPTVVDSLGATWGLHLLDVNLPYGDLVDLVRAQSKAYAAAN